MDMYFWNAYKRLEKEVVELSEYIHISDDQLSVYSLKIGDLLVRTAIEAETLVKLLYHKNGGTKPNGKDLYFDTDCFKLLKEKWGLSQKTIFVTAPSFFLNDYKILRPLHKAHKRGTSSSKWQIAYQAVKHDRMNNQKSGNIGNLLLALGALYILNVYYRGANFSNVTADKPFTTALMEYTYKLDGQTEKGSFTAEDARRRPDIFICRGQALPGYQYSSFLEEQIIVELKRPSVVIGTAQLRQIQDYRDIILGESLFNSQVRKWKFIVVGKEVDESVKNEYKTFADKNRPMLVHFRDNFEIYAMTWDDVFLTFEYRERFILEKLKFDKQVVHDEVEAYTKTREGSDTLTNDILSLNTQ